MSSQSSDDEVGAEEPISKLPTLDQPMSAQVEPESEEPIVRPEEPTPTSPKQESTVS